MVAITSVSPILAQAKGALQLLSGATGKSGLLDTIPSVSAIPSRTLPPKVSDALSRISEIVKGKTASETPTRNVTKADLTQSIPAEHEAQLRSIGADGWIAREKPERQSLEELRALAIEQISPLGVAGWTEALQSGSAQVLRASDVEGLDWSQTEYYIYKGDEYIGGAGGSTINEDFLINLRNNGKFIGMGGYGENAYFVVLDMADYLNKA